MLADRGIRLDEATDLIKRALAEDPNNAAYQDSLGWAYLQAEQARRSGRDCCARPSTRESHDPTILSHLGDVYAKMGKDESRRGAMAKIARRMAPRPARRF